MNRMLSAIAVLAMLLSAPCAFGSPNPKAKLIFHIDSGPGNGVAAVGDCLATERLCQVLRPLRTKYDVYVLINPEVNRKENLKKVLDTLVRCDQPFVLDVLTSDTWTAGSHTPVISGAYDVYHGVSISIDEARRYGREYGKYFAGMRIHEILASDFSVEVSREPKEDWTKWYHEHYKLPKDRFFQPSIVEPFLKLAKENRMFVQWSDFHWMGNCSWDNLQKGREDQIIALLGKYRAMVHVTYANNEPNEDSVKRLGNWQEIVSGFVKYGAAGFGLSNQSWMRADFNNTSIDEMIAWTDSALSHGASIIQFEPPWYYFAMPQYASTYDDYTSKPEWKNRGIPKDNFRRLSEFLLSR